MVKKIFIVSIILITLTAILTVIGCQLKDSDKPDSYSRTWA